LARIPARGREGEVFRHRAAGCTRRDLARIPARGREGEVFRHRAASYTRRDLARIPARGRREGEVFSFEHLAGSALSARIPQRDAKAHKIDLQITTSPD
jgi:hypothetical protein